MMLICNDILIRLNVSCWWVQIPKSGDHFNKNMVVLSRSLYRDCFYLWFRVLNISIVTGNGPSLFSHSYLERSYNMYIAHLQEAFSSCFQRLSFRHHPNPFPGQIHTTIYNALCILWLWILGKRVHVFPTIIIYPSRNLILTRVIMFMFMRVLYVLLLFQTSTSRHATVCLNIQ